LIHQIGNCSNRIDGHSVAVDDTANDVSLLVAKNVAVQECRKGALISGAIIVRQTKLSLIAIP
jgi:hypothetical protein